MTALEKGVIVIDLDETFSFNVKYMLSGSFKNVAIINTKAFCSRFEDVKQIMKDSFLFKMIYGCDEREYKIIIDNLTPVGDIFYLGKRLFFSEAVICYWKNKGFQQFSPTIVSSGHNL